MTSQCISFLLQTVLIGLILMVNKNKITDAEGSISMLIAGHELLYIARDYPI